MGLKLLERVVQIWKLHTFTSVHFCQTMGWYHLPRLLHHLRAYDWKSATELPNLGFLVSFLTVVQNWRLSLWWAATGSKIWTWCCQQYLHVNHFGLYLSVIALDLAMPPSLYWESCALSFSMLNWVDSREWQMQGFFHSLRVPRLVWLKWTLVVAQTLPTK